MKIKQLPYVNGLEHCLENRKNLVFTTSFLIIIAIYLGALWVEAGVKLAGDFSHSYTTGYSGWVS